MKKIAVWGVACLFALSLTGDGWAQREEKATEITPPMMESPSTAPAEKAVAPESIKKTSKRKASTKAKKQTTCKRTVKNKKKARTAKKVV